MENFEMMYDLIYDKLAENKIAEVWDEEKMLDRKGNIITNKEDMYGCPPKYKLTHSKKLIFVDEVGETTSRANGGNKTGTTYVTGNGRRAQQHHSFTDCHRTTLGFTAATLRINWENMKNWASTAVRLIGKRKWKMGTRINLEEYWQKKTCVALKRSSPADLPVNATKNCPELFMLVS
jgi:hypothetical protein